MEKIKYKASVGAIIWWVIGGIISNFSMLNIITFLLKNQINKNDPIEMFAGIIAIGIFILIFIIGIIFILIGFGLRNSNRKKQLMKKQIEIQEKILANQELLKQQAINNT